MASGGNSTTTGRSQLKVFAAVFAASRHLSGSQKRNGSRRVSPRVAGNGRVRFTLDLTAQECSEESIATQ